MTSRNPVIVMQVPVELNFAEGNEFLLEMQPLLEGDRPRIVLDCSQVMHVDSAGVELLLRCMEEAMKRDGDVKLASVSPTMLAILELMRADRVFEMYESTETAVASFQYLPSNETQQTLPWYSAEFNAGSANAAD
ncbi:MAG TPA: STAS domain-containing protein [Candidatus Binatia bacterium]|nr:STAS domain-containing protein [Candidatus Binatia bacterium]